MGALWQYRWLVLVLLIAPTIAYCQYRAVEKLATERCANAGGTWDEERDECAGLPAPRASTSGGSEEDDAATTVESTGEEPDAGGVAPTPESPVASGAVEMPAGAYDVQLLPAEGAGEARVEAPPGETERPE